MSDSKSTEELKPSNSVELDFKATILRPLADKFQELTRQVDSGEYKLPKTIQEAERITESYVQQAWERAEQLIDSYVEAKVLEERESWKSAMLFVLAKKNERKSNERQR